MTKAQNYKNKIKCIATTENINAIQNMNKYSIKIVK